MMACTNAYWPRSGERGSTSRARNSRRLRSCSRGSRSSVELPVTAESASRVKLLPRMAASCSRARSAGSRPSNREAIRACRVSGTSSSPRSATSSYASAPARRTPRSTSIRITSTAYSGMPSARSTMRSTVASFASGTSPRTSSAMVASGSGSRCSDWKVRVPAPQVGRRSASSGRANVRTKIGRSRDHSSSDSMKSSKPASAHCRSSKTIATVPASLIRSKNVRQAANSSSPPPVGRSSRPSRNASRGSSHRRSSSSGTCWATDTASLERETPGASVSAIPARIRTISPSAQKVMPSP